MGRLPIVLYGGLILASTLACQAAARLISPDAPTPAAPPATATLPSPASTPTSLASSSCPAETSSILQASNNPSYQNSSFPNVDTDGQTDIPLVTYAVQADQITNPIIEKVPANLIKYQNDFALQKKAWDLFETIFPYDTHLFVRQYEIITDGPGGVLGAVEQTPSDPNSWMLEVDIADIPDTKNLVFTMLHEFGHLLSLNSSQVPPDLKVFDNPASDAIYNQEAGACPTYFPGEGCSLEKSYINAFYQQFWAGVYEEWQKIDSIANDQKRQNRLEAFYEKYQAQFVDDYAVTDPSEDLAETWAYYVLAPKPEGKSIAAQKINFFYQYPDLVQLRLRVLQNLCRANP